MFKMRQSSFRELLQRKTFNNKRLFSRARSSSPSHFFSSVTRAKEYNSHFPLAAIHFALQSEAMQPDRAAEHLEVIRTLMERSAVYRRALAPVMTLAGVLGTAAAAGWLLHFETPLVFTGFWLCV